MNSIFQELLHEGVLANYMDNFVIPARTMEELEERTIQFLKIAEKHNLCFKQSKCDFNMEEIPILGIVVGKGQVKMEQEKIKAVKKQKTPTKIKDIEFPWICQLLLMVHPQLQPHSKTVKRIEGQEEMEMGKGTSKGI